MARGFLSAALLAALCSTLAVPPAQAQGQTAVRRLRDGIAAFNQVEYGQALTHLSAALKIARRPELLARIYFYLGSTQLALDKRAEAKAAFETLLAIRPAFVPDRDRTSPKIASFFSRVRRSYQTPEGAPSMAHAAPANADPRLTRLSLSVLNLSPRLRPVLRYRSSASPGFFMVEAERGSSSSKLSFVVPTPPRAEAIHYYFQLVAADGVVVGQLGSEESPYRLTVGAKTGGGVTAGKPWYKRWWVWAIAGGVVAAGVGVGLGVGLSSGDAGHRAQVSILANGKPVF